MLAIVRIALRRPYTLMVAVLLILLIGTLAALRMPVDIFPRIDIPIIGVAFQYQVLPPDQMAGRSISPFERSLTTTVNDIEHIEAKFIYHFRHRQNLLPPLRQTLLPLPAAPYEYALWKRARARFRPPPRRASG